MRIVFIDNLIEIPKFYFDPTKRVEMYPIKFNRYSIVFLVVTILVGYDCAAFGEFQISSSSAKPATPYLNPYEARSYPDKLEIYRGDKKVSVIRSEKPNIERWGFINSGNLVVVKSRGEDLLTIYELFETATGVLQDEAVRSDDNGRLPIWAVGFAE